MRFGEPKSIKWFYCQDGNLLQAALIPACFIAYLCHTTFVLLVVELCKKFVIRTYLKKKFVTKFLFYWLLCLKKDKTACIYSNALLLTECLSFMFISFTICNVLSPPQIHTHTLTCMHSHTHGKFYRRRA